MKIIADNTRVIGMVYDNAVIGKVLTSRHYGKKLLYTVQLDNPITFRWRDNPVDIVLLDNKQIKAAPLL